MRAVRTAVVRNVMVGQRGCCRGRRLAVAGRCSRARRARRRSPSNQQIERGMRPGEIGSTHPRLVHAISPSSVSPRKWSSWKRFSIAAMSLTATQATDCASLPAHTSRSSRSPRSQWCASVRVRDRAAAQAPVGMIQHGARAQRAPHAFGEQLEAGFFGELAQGRLVGRLALLDEAAGHHEQAETGRPAALDPNHPRRRVERAMSKGRIEGGRAPPRGAGAKRRGGGHPSAGAGPPQGGRAPPRGAGAKRRGGGHP